MAKVQKTSTKEFKEEAVRLVQTSDKPIAQVAREPGISETSIHHWRKGLTKHEKDAFPGSGRQTAVFCKGGKGSCALRVEPESSSA